MTPRQIISLLSKQVYRQDYTSLKEKLLYEYAKLQISQTKNHDRTLEKLLISGEDHRFRYHFGFDVIAIARAIKNRVFYKKNEGASTIEQQLVRVLTNNYQKTFKRKFKEIILSTTLSEIIPRKDIPSVYLQVAYFGTGMQGLEEVFKKFAIENTNKISNELCAEIIARIKYPEPKTNSIIRLQKIEMRKKHLLYLFNKHSSYKQFKIYG